MHLTDADVGASLDPSGGGAKGIAARAHAATCVACARAVRRAQAADQDVAGVLQLLDHPSPSPDFVSVRRLVAERDHVLATSAQSVPNHHARHGQRGPLRLDVGVPVGKLRERTGRMGRIQVVIRRGAIILGISAVAAAAAAPHSPVWRFILQRPATPRRSTASPARDASTTAPLAESAASTPQGVAINPTGRVELDFRNTPAAGVLRIRTTRGVGVAVTASVDGPTYLVGRGTIVIDSRGTPGVTYDVELPPPARVSDVVIQIGARVVFARHGADVRTQAQLESDGSYRVAMAPADSLSAP